MCGRFFLVPDLHELLALLHAAPEGLAALRGPRWNIPPTQPVVVVRPGEAGPRSLAPARWGLVPSWWKEVDKLPAFFNARAETAATKPSFRAAVKYRRVLIPATGFYEWDQAKQPHAMARTDGDLLVMAGLGSVWTVGGHALETCAVLTVAAGPAMRGVHDRMPAILDRTAWDAWLDPATPVPQAMALCAPRADGLDVVPVGRSVGDARNTSGDWFDALRGVTP